ncbi:TM0106 family RecB-like putative nuclease [Propionicimonas sp.]|uniref:TM0106 family RecB-like putative nuclease n=1 Tax=Propionicimonas sp. TaxID=1955623 RepID=UPI0039E6A3D1
MFVLDPYAARSCPLKVHNAFHPGLARPDAAPPPRLPGGAEFTTSVLDRVAAGAASVADLRGLAAEPSQVQEAACLAALAAGTDVVIGGLLPRDRDGHRSGRPDLLVRDGSGYVPGTVKYQRVVDVRRDDLPATFSALADLPARAMSTGWRYRWHWRWQNSLQLAHLWRLLGATGHQAVRPWGLVIGNDEIEGEGTRATWLDLTEPAVPPAPGQVAEQGAPGDPIPPVSALARYDHEFALRVDIAELASAAEPEDPPLLRPVVSFECTHCIWWTVCREQLDDDDISLRINKSPLDTHEIAVLREAGIETVHQLASTDIDALLPDYLPRVAHRPGAEDRLRLAQRRSRLLLEGVQLQRTTAGPIPLPRAPLEIDIDVETSRDDRVYLWGFWVAGGDGAGSYHAFSSFCDLDDAGELALARAAMTWLRDLVDGSDALVFHYSDYEVVRLRRLAPPDDEVMQWAVGFAEDHFQDLFAAVRQHFFGANGLGLKVVASAGAGFHWRDDDPGGLNSMRWFDDAVHSPSEAARAQARTRVLEYNEDDVKATWHLRRWLRELT